MKNLYLDDMHRFLLLLFTFFLLLSVVLFKDRVALAIKESEFAHSPAKNELISDGYLERILLSDGKFDPEAKTGVWFNKSVGVPNAELARVLSYAPESVLGTTNEEKWIEVDLTTQTLFAHEGNRTVLQFPISSGLPWFPTVTGEFRIWSKFLAARMTGGSVKDGTFYDLPNVPYIQYFYKGYGLHGAYWHHDFGKPRSHGCVNISIDNARLLFYWTNPPLPAGQAALANIDPATSTRVVVHGTTPTNIY